MQKGYFSRNFFVLKYYLEQGCLINVQQYFPYSFVLALFVFLVLYHGRQVEITSSLDFLWKQQAKKELEEMSEMRRHTNQLLQNILPLHVAKYFLEQDRQAEVKKCIL